MAIQGKALHLVCALLFFAALLPSRAALAQETHINLQITGSISAELHVTPVGGNWSLTLPYNPTTHRLDAGSLQLNVVTADTAQGFKMHWVTGNTLVSDDRKLSYPIKLKLDKPNGSGAPYLAVGDSQVYSNTEMQWSPITGSALVNLTVELKDAVLPQVAHFNGTIAVEFSQDT